MTKYLLPILLLSSTFFSCTISEELQSASFCEKYISCQQEVNEKSFDSDAQNVCVTEQRYYNDILRANSEKDCEDILSAKYELRDCALKEDSCTEFIGAIETGDKCKNERETYKDAANDGGEDCQVRYSSETS